MYMLLVPQVFQHGPNGGFTISQSWIWVLLVIPLSVAIFILYRLFFPELNKVKITEKLEELVEQETSKESVVKEREREAVDVESKKVVKSQTTPIDVALRLMRSDERKVIETLLEADGSLLQKEISWKTGFSRVKTHRILVRLIQRDVVTSEKYYNTNKITLAEWLLHPKGAG